MWVLCGHAHTIFKKSKISFKCNNNWRKAYLFLILLNIVNDFANPKPKFFRRQTTMSVWSNRRARHASHPSMKIWLQPFIFLCIVRLMLLVFGFPPFMIAFNVVMFRNLLGYTNVELWYPWYIWIWRCIYTMKSHHSYLILFIFHRVIILIFFEYLLPLFFCIFWVFASFILLPF